ncbi:MAG: tyrosine-protein phosphatase [Pseudomonadota bacterium]
MLRKMVQWLDQKERSYRYSFGRDIVDPAERKRSLRHYHWMDHGILRYRWHNFAVVAPGVYRSNHPHHDRFAAYAEMGVKAVLNLRGKSEQSHYLFEVESCKTLGLDLVTVHLGARNVPLQHRLVALLDAFESLPRPFMMHCKSGADRTGLASAFYLLHFDNASDDVARAQLSFRHLHIRKTKTGILDYVLETYLAARRESGIALRDWVETGYDEKVVAVGYKAKKAKEPFWRGWRAPMALI